MPCRPQYQAVDSSASSRSAALGGGSGARHFLGTHSSAACWPPNSSCGSRAVGSDAEQWVRAAQRAGGGQPAARRTSWQAAAGRSSTVQRAAPPAGFAGPQTSWSPPASWAPPRLAGSKQGGRMGHAPFGGSSRVARCLPGRAARLRAHPCQQQRARAGPGAAALTPAPHAAHPRRRRPCPAGWRCRSPTASPRPPR